MKLPKLFRRSALRFGLTLGTIFAATIILVFASLYWRLAAELNAQLVQQVLSDRDALVDLYHRRGFGELSQAVHSEARSVREAAALFLLQDALGDFVAGNVQGVPHFDGWQALHSDKLTRVGPIPGDDFVSLWTQLDDDGWLLVGVNRGIVTSTQQMLARALAMALIATLIVAAGSGAWIAHRAQQRIDAMAKALETACDGNLAVRLPISSAADDLDFVAREVNLALQRLEHAIERVNQSSSDIAHDLKRPLGRLRQQLEAALAGAGDLPELRHRVQSAIGDVDTIVETFEALLRINQIEAGERRDRFAPIDLAAVVGDVAGIYEAVAEDAGHRLAVDLAPLPSPMVIGDHELLVQLFVNLVENAIHHCPPPAEITLSLRPDAGRLVAEVADNGPGIPEGERDRVFNRFYRLDKSRTGAGNGLGLSLVAAICELHGARIELHDNAPGLRVRLSFPQAA
jgi:signal transduction histidine kinase